MKFGAHTSIAGGLYKAFARGTEVGCDTIQIFTKSQQQWRTKPLAESDIEQFRHAHAQTDIGPILVHASYLINLASPNDELWERSITAFGEELERCNRLGIPYVVVHPGAHTGAGEAYGLQRITEALDRLFEPGTGDDVTVLLETTAGQGSSLGHRFEHLANIVQNAQQQQRLGICIDTCHIFAAGYDIRTTDTYTATCTTLAQTIDMAWVKAFHLNDSQKGLGSRVDRHAHIGEGQIGLEGFRAVVNDPRFANLPMIIETPKGNDGTADSKNLQLLRSLVDHTPLQQNSRQSAIK
ncbi:MAG: deoxyribonuclease IV [Chloroflexota bacterium]